MLNLQRIKDRLAAATPGPWYREVTGVAHGGVRTEKTWLFADDGATEADAKLVANAPADLAALVAEVELRRGWSEADHEQMWTMAGNHNDLEAEVERLRALIIAHRDECSCDETQLETPPRQCDACFALYAAVEDD